MDKCANDGLLIVPGEAFYRTRDNLCYCVDCWVDFGFGMSYAEKLNVEYKEKKNAR
jgi:hypothetical protein